MRRGPLLLTIVAAVLVFAVVLALHLPAHWFAGMLPAEARCGELGGSVWRGECVGLTLRQQKLGDLTWNVAPGRVLTGRVVGDVQLTGKVNLSGGDLHARAELDVGFDGDGELRNVTASIPLDPALSPNLPPDQRGTVIVDLERVAFAAGNSLRELRGTVRLRELRQVGRYPLVLGSYSVRFDGPPQADGTIVGILSDDGGPYAVSGTVTLIPPGSYLVSGSMAGRSPEAEALVRQLTLGAPPDATGKRPFSFEGTY